MTFGQISAVQAPGPHISQRETAMRRTYPIALALAALLAGLVFRWAVRAHETGDTSTYREWYAFVHDRGFHALRDAFTNYAPFYSYLLVIATEFDKFGQPLSLVKAISAVFELGCAATVAEMVWHVTRSRWRTTIALASIWVAPTTLLNGGMWAQADAIWGFFILISVSLFMRKRNGTLPFAMAIAVKAQGVFLGPLVLGLMIRRRMSPFWLLAIPVVYLCCAIPVMLAGRPIGSVLNVYLAQAETFQQLTMNAANIWVFAASLPYAIGLPIGLVIAGLAGLALAVFIGRTRETGPEFILLAACASLFLMPYLLPKMHDRYFYAFELSAIALACINGRYLPLALIAQVDGVLACLGFDPGIIGGIMPAALGNSLLGIFLLFSLRNDEDKSQVRSETCIGFVVSVAALMTYLFVADGRYVIFYILSASFFAVMSALLLRQAHGTASSRALDRPARSL